MISVGIIIEIIGISGIIVNVGNGLGLGRVGKRGWLLKLEILLRVTR